MYFKKVILLILLVFVILSKAYCQVTEIDSIKTLIYSDITDTSKVNKFLQLAEIYIYTEPDSAQYYASKALVIAQKSDFLFGVLRSYSMIGFCHIFKSEYYESQAALTKALDISLQLVENEPNNTTYRRSQSKIHLRFGHIHYYQGNYDLAIKSFINAVKILEEIGDEHGAGTALSNISVVYESLHDFEKAIEYNYKALSIGYRNNDNELLAHISNNLAVDYIRLDDYDSAYYYISKCIQINEAENIELDLRTNYLNLGRVFLETQNYDSALFYLNKSLKICTKTNYIVGLIDVNHLMGRVYLDKKDYSKAEKQFKKSLALAQEAGITNSAKNANDLLSDVYKAKGDYKKAYEYYVLRSKLADNIFNEESDARIADMETKYRTEKKEEEIKLLQETAKLDKATAKTNRIIFSAVIVILILVIILVIMSYRSYKHKQLAEHHIIQQNAERKVLDAVIETEYKERKRFAEDLHDGLGVLLSTTRLYINEIEGSTEDERKTLVKQSNSMLDDAITNVRNISNNIMPASLKNNGLEMAIRSFCDRINSTGSIKITLQSINFKKHYKNIVEITLYRILTEMINNTLKHAEATEISISFAEKANKIFVTYIDNGIGFDYELMINSLEKGMGLDNTISRINSIGGTCSIESKPAKGFAAAIEVRSELIVWNSGSYTFSNIHKPWFKFVASAIHSTHFTYKNPAFYIG